MKKTLTAIAMIMAATTNAYAGAQVISVPSDPKAQYAMVVQDVGFGKEALLVITRRVGPSGTTFSLREVNCYNSTFRYKGEGSTLENVIANVNDKDKMAPLTSGSISYYVALAACK